MSATAYDAAAMRLDELAATCSARLHAAPLAAPDRRRRPAPR